METNLLDMRDKAKLRQTDQVMRLYAIFGSADFQKAYQKINALEYEDFAGFMKKFRADIEVRTELYSVGIFFEGVGVLAKRKLINMDLVAALFRNPVSQTWKIMDPL